MLLLLQDCLITVLEECEVLMLESLRTIQVNLRADRADVTSGINTRI